MIRFAVPRLEILLLAAVALTSMTGPVHATGYDDNNAAVGFTQMAQSADLFDASPYPWQAPIAGDERSPCVFLNTLANHGIINRNGTFIDVFEIVTKLEEVFAFSPQFIYQTKILPAIECGQTYEDTAGILRLNLQGLFAPRCNDFRSILVRSPDDITAVNQTLLDNLLAMDSTRGRNATKVQYNTSDDALNDTSALALEDIALYHYNRIFDVYDTTYNDPTFGIAGSDFMSFETLSLGLLGLKPESATVEKDRLFTFLRWERLPSPLLRRTHDFSDTHDSFYIFLLDIYLSFEDAKKLTFYAGMIGQTEETSNIEISENEDDNKSKDTNDTLRDDFLSPNNTFLDGVGSHLNDHEMVFDDSVHFDDSLYYSNFDDSAQFDDTWFTFDDTIHFGDTSYNFDDSIHFDDISYNFDDSAQFDDTWYNFDDDSAQFDDTWFTFDDDSAQFDDSAHFDDTWYNFDDRLHYDDMVPHFDDNTLPLTDDPESFDEDGEVFPIIFDDIVETVNDTFSVDDDMASVDDGISFVDDTTIFNDNIPVSDEFNEEEEVSFGNVSVHPSQAASDSSVIPLPAEIPSETITTFPTGILFSSNENVSTSPTDEDPTDYHAETLVPTDSMTTSYTAMISVPPTTVISGTSSTASNSPSINASGNLESMSSFLVDGVDSIPSDTSTNELSETTSIPTELATRHPFEDPPAQVAMPALARISMNPSLVVSSIDTPLPTSATSVTPNYITTTETPVGSSTVHYGELTATPASSLASTRPTIANSSPQSKTPDPTESIPIPIFIEPPTLVVETNVPTEGISIDISVENSASSSSTSLFTFIPTDITFEDYSTESSTTVPTESGSDFD